MFTTTITIGRNFGTTSRPELQGQAMSNQLWSQFRHETAEIARAAHEAILSSGHSSYLSDFNGRSFWEGEPEDSAIFQIITEVEFDEGTRDINELYLAELADTYGQDAIAVIWNAQATLVSSPEYDQIDPRELKRRAAVSARDARNAYTQAAWGGIGL